MRYWIVILLASAGAGSAATVSASADTVAQWERDGRSFFFLCEFKQATRAFEKALAPQPERAALHYWLGKSYARLAEVSSPLSAAKNARRARRSLEQAVKLAPRDDEYLQELFDLYVDSPQWFSGGLERAAALLERLRSGGYGAELQSERLAESRKEHSGAGWWAERAVLWMSGAVGHVVPRP